MNSRHADRVRKEGSHAAQWLDHTYGSVRWHLLDSTKNRTREGDPMTHASSRPSPEGLEGLVLGAPPPPSCVVMLAQSMSNRKRVLW